MLRKVAVHYLLEVELNTLRQQFECDTEQEVRQIEQAKFEEFKTLVQKEDDDEHFKCPHDESFLYPFLRVAKHDPEKALRKLKKFVKMRCDKDYMLKNLDDNWPENEIFNHVRQSKALIELNSRSNDGCVLKFGIIKPQKNLEQTIIDLTADIIIHAEMVFINPAFSVTGCIFIIDVKNFSYNHVFQLIGSKLRNLLSNCRDTLQRYPLKLKEVHLVNAKPIIKLSLSAFLSVVSRKIQGRFMVHPDFKSVEKHIGKSILPEINKDTYEPVLSVAFVEDHVESLLANKNEIFSPENFSYTPINKSLTRSLTKSFRKSK